MNPSFHLLSSQYCHRENPSLALAPASGDEGEFVAFPLVMNKGPLVVSLMLQAVFPPGTNRNLGAPPTFLKTGCPRLHLPSSNLRESKVEFLCLNIFGTYI